YLDQFASSRYFRQRPPVTTYGELEWRLRSGELRLAIEVPPGFGKDLQQGRRPEVAVWLDAAMPSRAETTRGDGDGVQQLYVGARARRDPTGQSPTAAFDLEVRFRYNQDFKSVYAMAPGVIMLVLVLLPTMMTALGVVREKEVGSITNLYTTPVT